MDPGHLNRRRWLLGALAGALGAACGSAPEVPRPPPPLPPLRLDRLDRLAAGAGIAWLVRLQPRAIASIPWLIPSIGALLPEKRLDAYRDKTGLDLRQLSEAWLVQYGDAFGGSLEAIVRHAVPPIELERRFRARLTSEIVRTEERPDLVRISGRAGTEPRAFARMGSDVAVYQSGGDGARGPARIASLYARGKLDKVQPALDVAPLGALFARFGEAPVIAVAPGPFDPELARAARGLLASATGVGAALRPTARENVGLALAIAGDFGDRGAEAAEILQGAWDDVAGSTMGRLLSLDRPIERPVAAGDSGVVTLAAEFQPDRLAEGLRAVAAEDLDAIMRLD
jgi:hypothetical protein